MMHGDAVKIVDALNEFSASVIAICNHVAELETENAELREQLAELEAENAKLRAQVAYCEKRTEDALDYINQLDHDIPTYEWKRILEIAYGRPEN